MVRRPLGAARSARSEHIHVDSNTSPLPRGGASREAATTLYEIACSIAYPTESAHLSIRVSGQHTYRNAPTREIPFTRHEAGATTYVELLEREQLEVRIVEHGGAYAKAVYYAYGQALTEQHVRRITSTLQRIDAPSDTDRNGNAD